MTVSLKIVSFHCAILVAYLSRVKQCAVVLSMLRVGKQSLRVFSESRFWPVALFLLELKSL